MDLLDWFRGVRAWPTLYELISRLPTEGHYKSALAMDMEYARQLARMEADGQVPPPVDTGPVPLRYGPVEQRLDLIADLLQFLRATIEAVNNGKPSAVKPLPRPMTALQKARLEIELAELDQLAAMVLGNGLPLI